MVFSSTVFLFIFLPFVLFANFLLKPAVRNLFLLVVSLFFYAWGEGILVLIMIFSCCINYAAGLAIDRYRTDERIVKPILAVTIMINLSFLIYYKYLGFLLDNLPFLARHVHLNTSIALPIGISFYTFHGISYLVDLYKKNIPALKSPVDVGLYIAFFPQLVAGPIVRYSDIAEQLMSRNVNTDALFYGCIRFIRGLAKKIIIANTVGKFVDLALQGNVTEMPAGIAWLCLIGYTLQIYYDFSGYSDMAIGLAKMFGFHFKENFDHPYSATSIQDFWRRWHISLSSWFRDYVYIPLGGNQKGIARTYVNLFIVFLITGMWHGASWNFIIWGLFHGLFIILERSKIINSDRFPVVIRHGYTMVVVMAGWVFFRFETLSDALTFFQSLTGLTHGHNYQSVVLLSPYFFIILTIGILFALPLRNWLWESLARYVPTLPTFRLVAASCFYIALFLVSVMELAQSSYNPFIYFRF